MQAAVLAERLPIQAANQALPLARLQQPVEPWPIVVAVVFALPAPLRPPRRRRPQASAPTQAARVAGPRPARPPTPVRSVPRPARPPERTAAVAADCADTSRWNTTERRSGQWES